MRKLLIQGIIAGILSAIACIIYQNVYQEMLFVDFGKVINSGSIIGACLISCLLMAVGYWLIVEKLGKPKLKGWVNIAIMLFSFISILGPISVSLPLDIEFPEMFIGLSIPMHFFPPMVFFGLAPFFDSKPTN